MTTLVIRPAQMRALQEAMERDFVHRMAPSISMRFNLPSARNASERPLGDQNSDPAPSVPSTGLAPSPFKARTHTRPSPPPATRGPEPEDAINANRNPSGESAKNV